MPIEEMTLAEGLEKGYRLVTAPSARRTADPTWGETATMVGLEVVPAIIGAWVTASPFGAAAGGGIGNWLSQEYRQSIGLSDEYSWEEGLTATVASGVPLGRLAGTGMAARTGIRTVQGVGIATAELSARVRLQRGEWPTAEEYQTTALFGGLFGGTLGAVEARFVVDRTGLDVKKGMTRPETKAAMADGIVKEGGPQAYGATRTDLPDDIAAFLAKTTDVTEAASVLLKDADAAVVAEAKRLAWGTVTARRANPESMTPTQRQIDSYLLKITQKADPEDAVRMQNFGALKPAQRNQMLKLLTRQEEIKKDLHVGPRVKAQAEGELSYAAPPKLKSMEVKTPITDATIKSGLEPRVVAFDSTVDKALYVLATTDGRLAPSKEAFSFLRSVFKGKKDAEIKVMARKTKTRVNDQAVQEHDAFLAESAPEHSPTSWLKVARGKEHHALMEQKTVAARKALEKESAANAKALAALNKKMNNLPTGLKKSVEKGLEKTYEWQTVGPGEHIHTGGEFRATLEGRNKWRLKRLLDGEWKPLKTYKRLMDAKEAALKATAKPKPKAPKPPKPSKPPAPKRAKYSGRGPYPKKTYELVLEDGTVAATVVATTKRGASKIAAKRGIVPVGVLFSWREAGDAKAAARLERTLKGVADKKMPDRAAKLRDELDAWQKKTKASPAAKKGEPVETAPRGLSEETSLPIIKLKYRGHEGGRRVERQLHFYSQLGGRSRKRIYLVSDYDDPHHATYNKDYKDRKAWLAAWKRQAKAKGSEVVEPPAPKGAAEGVESLQPNKWYVATVDDGIVAGPFNSKSVADLEVPDQFSKKPWKESSYYESGRHVVGRGVHLEEFNHPKVGQAPAGAAKAPAKQGEPQFYETRGGVIISAAKRDQIIQKDKAKWDAMTPSQRDMAVIEGGFADAFGGETSTRAEYTPVTGRVFEVEGELFKEKQLTDLYKSRRGDIIHMPPKVLASAQRREAYRAETRVMKGKSPEKGAAYEKVDPSSAKEVTGSAGKGLSKLKQTIIPSALLASGGFAAMDEEDREAMSKAGPVGFVALLLLMGIGAATIPRLMRGRRSAQYLKNNVEARKKASDNVPKNNNGDEIWEEGLAAASSNESIGSSTGEPYRGPTWWNKVTNNTLEALGATLVPMSRHLKGVKESLAEAFRQPERHINQTYAHFLEKTDPFTVAMTKAIKGSKSVADWNAFRRALREKQYKEWTYGKNVEEGTPYDFDQVDIAGKAEKTLGELMTKHNDSVRAYMRKKYKQDHGAEFLYERYNSAMADVRTLLRERGGLPLGELKSYFPQGIKDWDSFRKYMKKMHGWKAVEKDVEDIIAAQGKRWGATPNSLERAEIASSILRQRLEGGGTPKHLRERMFFKVDDDMLDAWYDPVDINRMYLRSMITAMETRHFLGLAGGRPYTMGADAVVDVPQAGRLGVTETRDHMNMTDLGIQADYMDGLPATVARLSKEHGVTGKDVDMLREVIKARFTARGHSQLLESAKNVTYIGVLGNFGSAITQFGDNAYSIHFNGMGNTFRAWFDRTQPDWYKKLGLDTTDIDLQSSRDGLAKVLNTVLKWTGFAALDKFGKNTVMKSTFFRMQKDAFNAPRKLRAELEPRYGREATEMIMKDLKSDDPFTDLVEGVMWSKLSDYQPVSRIEMPRAHAAAGGMMPGIREAVGASYWLKSFTIKQWDVVREASNGHIGKARKLWREAESLTGEARSIKRHEAMSEAARGMSGVVGLAVIFGAMNAGTSMVKDAIYGRPTDAKELSEDILWRLVGGSRYHSYKVRREGPFRAAVEFFMPATTAIDRAVKDLYSLSEGEAPAEFYRGIMVGDFYYWWHGGGREKIRRDLAKRRGVPLSYIPE